MTSSPVLVIPISGFIYSLRTRFEEAAQNKSLITYEYRNTTINPATNRTYIQDDVMMESKYLGFSLGVKAIAFIPSLAGFILFVTLIIIYGRAKPTKKDPYAGRVMKIPKRKTQPLGMFTIVKMKLMRKRVNTQSEVVGDTVDGVYSQPGEESSQPHSDRSQKTELSEASENNTSPNESAQTKGTQEVMV